MARQHMHVKVKHRLPARCAIGLKEGDAIGVKRSLCGHGHALCGLHDGGCFFGRQFQQGHCVALAGDQHMARVDLADVHERYG